MKTVFRMSDYGFATDLPTTVDGVRDKAYIFTQEEIDNEKYSTEVARGKS